MTFYVTLNKPKPIDLNYSIKVADYNDRITLDYELIVDDNILDSSFDKNDPLSFVIGEGKVIKGFEKGVLGLTEGQEKTFVVSPEEGYGVADSFPYKTEQPLDEVLARIKEQTGKDLNAEAIQGGTFFNIYGQRCMFKGYDLNKNTQYIYCQHPLAGKTLKFSVKVLKIEKPAEYGIAPKDENK